MVATTQALMWHGWNASGVWIGLTGWSAVGSYALSAAVAAAPVVLSLVLLRHWLSLVVILGALTVYSLATARMFSTTDSSTAGIGWIGPVMYGLPIVVLVWFAEVAWSSNARRH